MIAVTGAAGFIGGEMVAALNRRGVTGVLAVDHPEALAGRPRLAALRVARTVAPDELLDLLRSPTHGIAAVLHLGACTDTMTPDWRYLVDNNLHYSRALLAACRRSRTRLVYASSAAVYGHGGAGFREEAACEAPINLYGLTKQLFDALVRRALAAGEDAVAGVRCFNVYGAHEAHKGRMASMVFQLARQAERAGGMRLFAGSESFRRDFVHVDDVVDVFLYLLDHPRVAGIFNCGCGTAASFLEIAELLRRHFGNAAIEWIPFPAELEASYQRYTCADLAALRAAGYARPFTPLADGISELVKRSFTSSDYLLEGRSRDLPSAPT